MDRSLALCIYYCLGNICIIYGKVASITNTSVSLWDNDERNTEPASTTLRDIGEIAVKMVETLAHDQDQGDIDLKGVTELISALSRAAVLVDHPKEMSCTDLNKRFDLLKADVDQKILKLEKENENLKQLVKAPAGDRENNGIGTPNNLTHIEFQAYATKTQNLGIGTVVKFDDVVRHAHGHYDPAFGFFTCPQDGDYFVSLTFKTSTGTPNLVIKVGNVISLQLDSPSLTQNQHRVILSGGSVSGTVIVLCRQNEKIWVESTASSGNIVGSETTRYSMLHVYHIR